MADKGFTDKVKGKAKEVVGELSGDNKTKAEGLADQAIGKAKEIVSDAKDVVGEVAEKAQKKLNEK